LFLLKKPLPMRLDRGIVLLILISFSSQLSAQIIPDGESVGDMVIYRTEQQGGVYAHTLGLGAFYRNGKIITAKKSRFYEVDISNIRHPKSFRGSGPIEENAKRYVFGKLNSFGLIRGGVGYNNIIHGKDRRKGVEVRYHYFGGPALGLAKPVYLEILVPEGGGGRRLETAMFNPMEHNVDNIYGRAPFTKGLTEIKPYIGLYGKLGVSFEYSGYDDLVKAIETGILVDAFVREIPIMAIAQNNRIFINFYISFVIGKREF
jgi:hypothetical protein